MNFSSMEYFDALARERSFTKAARRLHITQQSLSAHIASLERELGCQLVIRRSPLELTFAGEALLRHARRFLNNIDEMHKELSDISENQRGVLRVGVASTRGRVIMPAIVHSFQKEYPNVRIEISEATNDVLRHNLLEGKMDLAIARFPKAVPGVSLHDFYEEEVVLLVPVELLEKAMPDRGASLGRQLDAKGLAAFDGFPFVLGNPEDIAGSIGARLLDQSGARPKVTALSENAGTILSMCALGVGACFCPKNLVEAAFPDVRSAGLEMFGFKGSTRYPICFGHKDGPYQWRVMDEFMRIAKASYPATPASSSAS